MKNINEKLSEILDVTPIELEEKQSIKTELVVPEEVNQVDSDTEFARQNIKELIDAGNSAVNELAAVARDSQHPRAYEVMATLIKNMSDLNKDLLELHKRKKDLTGISDSKSKDVNIDKAVFVGSTAELMKLIKNK